MKYKIIKEFSKEDEQTEFDSVIEITGLRSEITVNRLLDHLEATKRVKKEQEGQMMVNKALMEKAVEELPILADIPADKLNLALSYVSKSLANTQAEDTIKACEETITSYEEHLKSIEDQTGIKVNG